MFLLESGHLNDDLLPEPHGIDVIGKAMCRDKRTHQSCHPCQNGEPPLCILWWICAPIVKLLISSQAAFITCAIRLSHSKEISVWLLLHFHKNDSLCPKLSHAWLVIIREGLCVLQRLNFTRSVNNRNDANDI